MTFIHSTYECGNYSREETIQGRKLFAEIRYFKNQNFQKHVLLKVGHLVQYSSKNFFKERLDKFSTLKNYFESQNFELFEEVTSFSEKCLFPLDAYVVSCPTRSKNLERTLVGNSTYVERQSKSLYSGDFLSYTMNFTSI